MSHDELLRLTAFHEAGHAEVAAHLTGLRATVEIWRDAEGRVQGWCCAGMAMRPEAQQLFAVAGSCAETLADAGWNFKYGKAMHAKLIASMSTTDVACLGSQGHMTAAAYLSSLLGVDLFDRGLNLCRQLWPSIDARARLEIASFHQRQTASTAACA